MNSIEINKLHFIGKTLGKNTSHLLYDRIPEIHRLTPSVILALSTPGGGTA
jgi:hypothetical protein